MTTATAKKLLHIVHTLEGMMDKVGDKQRFLKSQIHASQNDDVIKNATLILGNEIDNINVTIGLVEDLSEHLHAELQVA